MATTSGTVGTTQIDVSNLIEHSFRRCGKLASTISAELQLSAKENLFFLLSDLANRGRSLWCVQKTVLGVTANQIVYNMPVGTVDVYSAMYRTKTDVAGTVISGVGWQGLDLGSTNLQAIATISVAFTAAYSGTLVVEYSADLITWVQGASLNAGLSYVAGAWICGDVENSVISQYWRIRDTSGILPTVTTLNLSILPKDLLIGKMSNDDYVSLPNKTQTGARALQYFYDKQINPRIWVWPASNASTDQIVIWTQRQIQDIGSLSNKVEIPQYWLESIIMTLACRCALELPVGELPEGRYELLKAEAAERLAQAEDSQSDGSPIRISPRISGYTR